MHWKALFEPASIAVIGASTKPGSVGNDVLKNVANGDFTGAVYPVNPKAEELYGLRCFKNLSEIKHHIDLAIIIIPAGVVPGVLEEAGQKNIPAAIIISSGFKESGGAGKQLEDEIASIARKYSITLLGPNCLGFLNPKFSLNASFAPELPAPGDIAFFSQSGALCTALLDITQENGLGFSKFVSIGNEAVVNENDLLRFFAQDKETRVIGMYTEALENAPDLITTGRAILSRSQVKPIVALKAGLTAAGASASASHTGSLGGSKETYQALFTQSRIIQAKNLKQLLNFLTAFSYNPLPEGNRIAIITNAGGPGVLATDAAIENGLILAKLSLETENALKAILPRAASTHNPVDILGDAQTDRYTAALNIVTKDSNVDSLLIILTPQTMTEIETTAEAIIDLKKKAAKPIMVVFAGKTLTAPGQRKLETSKVSVVTYPEEGAEALSALSTVAEWRKNHQATSFKFSDIHRDTAGIIIETARQEKRATLSETEVWAVLAAYGFPLLRSAVAHSIEEAEIAGKKFDKPLALKIISPDIIHKSDAGGVLLNIHPENAGTTYIELLKRVAKKMPKAKLEGALLVEMAKPGGQEIILGIKKEPGLGSLIMCGLGGIYVETLHDVAFRFAPLTREDTSEMLSQLKAFPLLIGTRGQTGIDIEYVKDCVGRLSQLALDFPEIQELDINPLLAFPDKTDCRVLDGRMTISLE